MIVLGQLKKQLLHSPDRIYQIIVAEYTGARSSLSDLEMLLGPVILRERPELFGEFVERHISIQKKIILGKKLHFIPCRAEEELVEKLEALLNDPE